jgi:hypothetical protein
VIGLSGKGFVLTRIIINTFHFAPFPPSSLLYWKEKALVQAEEKRLPQKHNSSPAHDNNSTKTILSPLKDKLKQTTMGLLSEVNNKVTMNASKFKIPKYSISSNYNNTHSSASTPIVSSPSTKAIPLELSASAEKKAINKKESCGKEPVKVDSNYSETLQSSASNSNTKDSPVTNNDHSSSRKGDGHISKPSKKGSVKNSMGDIVQKYADVFSSVVACTGKS